MSGHEMPARTTSGSFRNLSRTERNTHDIAELSGNLLQRRRDRPEVYLSTYPFCGAASQTNDSSSFTQIFVARRPTIYAQCRIPYGNLPGSCCNSGVV